MYSSSTHLYTHLVIKCHCITQLLPSWLQWLGALEIFSPVFDFSNGIFILLPTSTTFLSPYTCNTHTRVHTHTQCHLLLKSYLFSNLTYLTYSSNFTYPCSLPLMFSSCKFPVCHELIRNGNHVLHFPKGHSRLKRFSYFYWLFYLCPTFFIVQLVGWNTGVMLNNKNTMYLKVPEFNL